MVLHWVSKNKTKVITLTYHKRHEQDSEAIKNSKQKRNCGRESQLGLVLLLIGCLCKAKANMNDLCFHLLVQFVTWTPENPNISWFPLKVWVVRSQLYLCPGDGINGITDIYPNPLEKLRCLTEQEEKRMGLSTKAFKEFPTRLGTRFNNLNAFPIGLKISPSMSSTFLTSLCQASPLVPVPSGHQHEQHAFWGRFVPVCEDDHTGKQLQS